jgi:hypothetical protein
MADTGFIKEMSFSGPGHVDVCPGGALTCRRCASGWKSTREMTPWWPLNEWVQKPFSTSHTRTLRKERASENWRKVSEGSVHNVCTNVGWFTERLVSMPTAPQSEVHPGKWSYPASEIYLGTRRRRFYPRIQTGEAQAFLVQERSPHAQANNEDSHFRWALSFFTMRPADDCNSCP